MTRRVLRLGVLNSKTIHPFRSFVRSFARASTVRVAARSLATVGPRIDSIRSIRRARASREECTRKERTRHASFVSSFVCRVSLSLGVERGTAIDPDDLIEKARDDDEG